MIQYREAEGSAGAMSGASLNLLRAYHHPDGGLARKSEQFDHNIPFMSRIQLSDGPIQLHARLDPVASRLVLQNGTPQTDFSFDLSDPTAWHVLAGTIQSPLQRVDVVSSSPTTDPRCNTRRQLERLVSEATPFDLLKATYDTINPSGNDNPDLVDHLRIKLYQEVDKQAKKIDAAEEKKAELERSNPKAATNIPNLETELQRLPQDVMVSLQALAMGDRGRLMQLVGEYKALEKIRDERRRLLRGVGEFVLLKEYGIPKSIAVTQHIAQLPEDLGDILSDEKRKLVRAQVSPQFADAAQRVAAATELTNDTLERMGLDHFSPALLAEAENLHTNGLEPQKAEKGGFISKDYSSLRLKGGQLTDSSAVNQKGVPFDSWMQLPITPLLMKNKEFRSVDASSEDPIKTQAQNLMVVLESGQVSNHGAHVAISPEVRQKMIDSMEASMRRGEPIKLEMYYTLARMSNPLEGMRRMPGLQDWAMMYKFGQISETAKLFYSPKDGKPAIQWVIIDEAQAFQDVWDLDPQETSQFRKELTGMLSKMGMGDTIIIDDLKRMALEGGAHVQDLIKTNYARIIKNWGEFKTSEMSLDQYVAFQQKKGDDDAKLAIGDVQTISDRHISMLRLVNPLKQHPDMSIDDLLAVYNGTMPYVELGDLTLTPSQQAILSEIEERALHANAFSKAVMDSRVGMRRAHPDAISVTITDKKDKLVVFPGDSRAQVFPGHGEAGLMHSHSASFGGAEPGKDFINVIRASGITSERVATENGTEKRYIGIVDPTNPTDLPYYYIENPAITSEHN